MFSWALHIASVSVSSVNVKTVIKSLFRLHFSGLHQPSPLDFQHTTEFSDLLIISAGFLWILSKFYKIKPWLGLQEKERNCPAVSYYCALTFLLFIFPPVYYPSHLTPELCSVYIEGSFHGHFWIEIFLWLAELKFHILARRHEHIVSHLKIKHQAKDCDWRVVFRTHFHELLKMKQK